jgi:type IV secretion system protein VirD4
MRNNDGEGMVLLVLALGALLLVACRYRSRWRGSGTAHGTARWADLGDLRGAGMLAGDGLILGRTPERGLLVRVPRYTHVMAVAPTGAGKGVSLVIPNLQTFARGSCFVWDPKGENYRLTAAARRALGQNVILLDPFGVTGDGRASCFNPLDLIEGGPRLVDEARALAEAVVVRTGSEPDPHWVESAVAVIHGMLVWSCCASGRRSATSTRSASWSPTRRCSRPPSGSSRRWAASPAAWAATCRACATRSCPR